MSKIALITGGQQGIGLGIAKRLISAGFQIAIASLPEERDENVNAVLKDLGENARYFQHDVADVNATAPLIERIENGMGQITSFISNAGVPAKMRGDMLDITPENFDHVMDVNLKGSFFLAQAIAKRMIAQESSDYRSMIFITSVSAQMVSINRAEYCISKAAASMMSQLFATRLAELNIGVFEVRPGIIATDMTAGVHEKYTKAIEEGLVPAKRWGKPDDIAQTILPLVEGHMAFSTGAIINVDGGLSIERL